MSVVGVEQCKFCGLSEAQDLEPLVVGKNYRLVHQTCADYDENQRADAPDPSSPKRVQFLVALLFRVLAEAALRAAAAAVLCLCLWFAWEVLTLWWDMVSSGLIHIYEEEGGSARQ